MVALARFFDSYAIIEILASNPAYSRFSDADIITTAANLAEVYYYALRLGMPERYRELIKRHQPELLQPNLDDWEDATEFRFKNRGKKLSYVDCLGYVLAEKNDLTFLTGDAAFKGMRNVEHVK